MIGGKTGTAETIDENTHKRSKDEYVVSFMGYAPADNPQIAIYVVVDRANAVRQDDAKFATGIVRNVLTEVLPYLQIFMTEELSEKEIKELEDLNIEITNLYAPKPEEPDGENGEENGEENGGDDSDNDTGNGQNSEGGSNAESVEPGEAPLGEDGPVNPNL